MVLPDTESKIRLLISQWSGTSTGTLVEGLLRLANEQLVQPLADLERQSDVDTANGLWMDYIGERLGFPRPLTTPDYSDPTLDFGAPVYAVRQNTLYTIRLTDGVMDSVGTIGWTPSAIAWVDDTLYAIHPDTRLVYTLDLDDGTPTATTYTLISQVGTITAAAVKDGLIWLVNSDKELWTFDPTSSDEATDITTLNLSAQTVDAIACLGTTLYVFASDLNVYRFATSTSLEQMPVGQTSVRVVTATTWEGAIYTSDADGNIRRVEVSPFADEDTAAQASFPPANMAFSGPEGVGFAGLEPETRGGRFATALTSLQGRVGIGDEWYRPMLRARARSLVGDGTSIDVLASASLLFTGGAVVNDGDHTNIWASINQHLYSVTVDPVTYTDIGDMGTNINGMAWLDGALYTITGGNLQTIDTATGARTTIGPTIPNTRGLTAHNGYLWSCTAAGALSRVETDGTVLAVGTFDIPGIYEALVSHQGVLYAISRNNPSAIYSVNTDDATLTLIGTTGQGITGAASVGPYIYAIDIDGQLFRITFAPFVISPHGGGGQTQVRGMASQFVPAVAYTDNRGSAYGTLAETHAAALLGLPAGVPLSVQRA